MLRASAAGTAPGPGRRLLGPIYTPEPTEPSPAKRNQAHLTKLPAAVVAAAVDILGHSRFPALKNRNQSTNDARALAPALLEEAALRSLHALAPHLHVFEATVNKGRRQSFCRPLQAGQEAGAGLSLGRGPNLAIAVFSSKGVNG